MIEVPDYPVSADFARLWLADWKRKHNLDPKTKLPRYGSDLYISDVMLGTWLVRQTQFGTFVITQVQR